MQPSAPVLKGHQTLIVARTKSSLASRRGTASPLISWAAYPSRRLGPRAAGGNVGRRRSRASASATNCYPHASSRWPPSLILRPRASPHPHLHTVLGKRTVLGSNPPAQRGCRGRQWLSEASEPHQVVLRAQIYCGFVTLRLLTPSHRAFLEIPCKKGHPPNPQVFTDLASHSLLRHSTSRPRASEPLEGKARQHGWGADAAEGPRARPLNPRAPYLRCSAGGRRSVQRAEGGGRLLPAQAFPHLFELKPSDC